MSDNKFQELKMLFLGMDSELSRWALMSLMNAGIRVEALVIPQSEMGIVESERDFLWLAPPALATSLPVVNPFLVPGVVEFAWKQGVKTIAVSNMKSPNVRRELLSLDPDLAFVACFPWLLPQSLLEAVPLGFINLHPSLLPAYRGPEPLFWIFREGRFDKAGVTIHAMSESFDAGDIIAQQKVYFADGISGIEAEVICGRTGGRMMADLVILAINGELPRVPQPAGGHYCGFPADSDFTVDVSWPARRAFNFIRGTSHWNRPYPIRLEEDWLTLREAVTFTPDGHVEGLYQRSDELLDIQFSPGTLKCVTAEE